MKNWKKFSRVFFLTLLVSLLAGVSAPAWDESASAAPMSASLRDVVISEVAWGGTAANSADEWIELYNPTSLAINLSGWTLISSDATPSISLTGIIQPGGYYLLESGDDFTISDVVADQTYSGGLNNTGEILTLRDGSSNIIDTSNSVTTAWDGGSGASNYYSMERIGIVADSVAAWTSNNGVTRNGLDAGIPNNCNPSVTCTTNPQSINGTPHTSKVDLSLAMVVNNLTPNIGDTVTFTITVSNINNVGYGTATNVTVLDSLPSGLTLDPINPPVPSVGTYNSGIWTVGTLPVNSSATLIIYAKVEPSGSRTNSAEVSFSDQVDADSTPGNAATTTEDDNSSVSVTPPSSADLSVINKVNNLDTINSNVCANVVFAITVTNNGVDDATNVEVTDLLPSAKLQYISHTAGMVYDSVSGIWNVGTLTASGAGKTKTLFITAKLIGSGTVTNNAQISFSDQSDPNSANNTDDSIINSVVGSNSDLKITQTSTPSTSVADTVNLVVTVFNNGPDPATSVQVEDNLPTGLTYVSYTVAPSGMSYNSSTGIWSIGNLAVGGSAILTITAQVDADGASTKNIATIVAADQCDLDSANNVFENEVPIADLKITETLDLAGSNTVFTITVSNAGPDDATGVKAKTSLPALTSTYTFISYGSTLGTYDTSTGIWTVGTLLDGAAATLTITTSASGSLVANWVEVSASDQVDPDSVPNNNSRAEDDDAGSPSADLSLTQVVNNLTPTVGANVVFTIAISNSGPAATANVKVKDLLPTGVTYVSYASTAGSYSSSTGIWTVGSLTSSGSGATQTLNITARVYSTGLKTNWAEVSNSDESDLDSTPGNGSTTEDDDASATITPITVATPTRTPTPIRTATPTRTPTRVPTATFISAVGRPIINEFLSRPGFDWNQDGKVDVFDEFIEIKNIGVVDINVGGWKLDDESEQGSSPFVLPSLVLKPGQRVIYYGLQTNILLSDGGDTVRLLNPSNKVYDAYTYAIAKVVDQSVCRLPDGNGSWYEDCLPTPNLLNSREGEVPSMPGGEDFESPVCELPDTLPADFLFAECRGYGADIWHSFFWDESGWQGEQSVFENMSKWESFVE